jgi:hypothetical protein
MNPKFRFDLAISHIIFLSDDGKTVCSFDDVLIQIHQMAENLSIVDAVTEKAKERITKQAAEMDLLTEIQQYKDAGFTGAFYNFLFESIHQYSVEQNPRCVKATKANHPPQEYIEKFNIPKFEALKTSLQTFLQMDTGFFPSQLLSVHDMQADVLAGDTYYSADLSCNAFLVMFRDMLLSMGMSICKCSVCGKAFCGKSGDFYCGSPACTQYLKEEKPKQKNDLSKISKNFSLYVRQYRYKIRENAMPRSRYWNSIRSLNPFRKPLWRR